MASVFYMDNMRRSKNRTTRTDDLLPRLAVPIRAAESASAGSEGAASAAGVGGALGAFLSDDPRLIRINEILDERIRPALAGDGGWLEIMGLKENTLTIKYQGACGSCPSSLRAL